MTEHPFRFTSPSPFGDYKGAPLFQKSNSTTFNKNEASTHHEETTTEEKVSFLGPSVPRHQDSDASFAAQVDDEFVVLQAAVDVVNRDFQLLRVPYKVITTSELRLDASIILLDLVENLFGTTIPDVSVCFFSCSYLSSCPSPCVHRSVGGRDQKCGVLEGLLVSKCITFL